MFGNSFRNKQIHVLIMPSLTPKLEPEESSHGRKHPSLLANGPHRDVVLWNVSFFQSTYIVTEIPFVDESSKWELLSLLGNWYEPESFESIFSSIASNAVFFSS